MTSDSEISLPQPKHPFAKWGAVVSVGLWALIAQNFPEPWNKIGALISPGVGYGVGYLLDLIAQKLTIRRLEYTLKDFTEQRKKILNSQDQRSQYGENNTMISEYDLAILSIEKKIFSIKMKSIE
jgi:hypothetical protein